MNADQKSERAQIARIRRLLAHHGQDLRRIRDNSRWASLHGPFFIEDNFTRGIVESGITDLDALEDELRAEQATTTTQAGARP